MLLQYLLSVGAFVVESREKERKKERKNERKKERKEKILDVKLIVSIIKSSRSFIDLNGIISSSGVRMQ